MRSRSRMLIVAPLACIVVAALLVASSRSLAQDQDKKNNMGGMNGMDPKQMQDAMMKAAQPGPEHEKLMKLAGNWDATVKMMQMDGKWSESKGSMHMEPILDGHYLMMKYEGSMDMGGGQAMPFKGMAISGYDNVSKKYFNAWFDSMGTGMMKTEGTMEGNVLTCTGTMGNPMTGKQDPVKEVMTNVDNDHMKYEMYGPGQDGNLMKMMEINYTRKM